MMYKNLYSKASEMADIIQERLQRPEDRTTKAFVDKARQGLVRRRESMLEQTTQDNQEGIAELISGYIANIRQANPVDVVEEFITKAEDEQTRSRPSGTFDFGDISDFAERMIQAESSGRPNVQITATSGGRPQNMTGLFQFSDDRLTDYMNDTGASFTTEDFRLDPNLQKDVFAWHVADIDRAIERGGFLEQGYDLNGLRAVAHLGGIGGMRQFVRSGGRYNPSDAEPGSNRKGTRLSDYYNLFSGQ
jgi:hypothetical protein